MNKEAYEAGVKMALDKVGLSWEWLKSMYNKHPYLAPAATAGAVGAGIGGILGGPREAAIGGIAGVGGSLFGTKAMDMLDKRIAARINAGDTKLIEHLVQNPKYLERMLRLTQAGTAVGTGAVLDVGLHAALPSQKHPLEKL